MLMDEITYFSIAKPTESELIIKKSQFLGLAAHVESEDEVRELLAARRKAHYKATHHVSAFRLADKTARSSDDGEPAGTAGSPVLSVLEKNNLTDTLVIVTRYFGGVKLGAGGLTRAYAQSAAQTLAEAKLICRQSACALEFQCDYSFYGALRSFAEAAGYRFEQTDFAQKVKAVLLVPLTERDECLAKIYDMSNGTVAGTIAGSRVLESEVKK